MVLEACIFGVFETPCNNIMFENKDNSNTSIENFGEFGLIDHLTKNFKIKQNSTVKGIGDDAAVISCDANKEIVVSTDFLLEGVHFDLSYMPLNIWDIKLWL